MNNKHPGGRPVEYDESIIQRAQEYIDSCNDVELTSDTNKVLLKVKLPSIEGLARHLRIARSTMYERKKKYPEFSDIIEDLLLSQAEKLLNNGLSGTYNPTITKVILTKHGYTDKQEIETKVDMQVNDITEKQASAIESLKNMFL